MLKEVKPSPDSKTIKPLTFDNLFTPMDVTSHFSTMLEPIMSASFLSSLSIIHGLSLKSHTNVL